MVDLFDEASRGEDLRRMAGCCTVMADCQGGTAVLAQVPSPIPVTHDMISYIWHIMQPHPSRLPQSAVPHMHGSML